METVVVDERLADEGADQSWATSDDAKEREKSPTGPVRFSGQRGDDAESLSRIVQPEADDKQHCETDFTGSGGLANRQSLRKVMQSNAHGDQQR